MRLDNFLRSTDVVFQTAEAPQAGDRFVRKMATYGQVRPSVSFTSQSRAVKPFADEGALDMSTLPNPLLDPKGDPREGTLEYPPPPSTLNNDYIRMMENHSLMLPSERRKEALMIKEGKEKFFEDRANLYLYRKRLTTLERHYPDGVTGIDGPTYPDTKLYAKQREHLLANEAHAGRHAALRHEQLAKGRQSDEALSFQQYGAPHDMARSQDLCIQRKCVEAQKHPYRFMDTHERLFPSYTPTWDPNRAAMQRSHDVRDKQHNIINGAHNELSFRVAPRWDDNLPQKTVYLNEGHSSVPNLTG